MDRRERRKHSSSFRAKVMIAATRGDKTLAEIAEQYDVHPNQIHDWKEWRLSEAEQVFEKRECSCRKRLIQKLRAAISELTMEKDCHPKRSVETDDGTQSADRPSRGMPVSRQSHLLDVSPSTAYYRPQGSLRRTWS